MCEREKREILENSLYENLYAQKMIGAGRIDDYLYYLEIMEGKCRNGMTSDEIDAVSLRADNAAKKKVRHGANSQSNT